MTTRMTTRLRAIISRIPSRQRLVLQFSAIAIVAASAAACSSEP